MKIFLVISIIFSVIVVDAQQKINKYPQDVESANSVVTAVLETISGNKGEIRNWDRFRNLFLSTAQINAVFIKNDSTKIKISTVDEFIESSEKWYSENDFHENVIKNNIDLFGNIAHVFQAYETKINNNNITSKGINSYQLVYYNNRWWIVNLIWESETNKIQIPEKYLK